jgi:multimeric flavodoxin WrbA
LKNIVLLTGSPRRGGNSDLLADSFIRGAEGAGHEVVKFETAFMDIKGCRGCNVCVKKGAPCVIRDDFGLISDALERADVIAFASPLYWLGVSGQLKLAWDRIHQYTRPPRRDALHIKESVFLIVQHADEPIYEIPVSAYRDGARFMGWTDRGVVAVTGVVEKGDITGRAELTQAFELGEGL